ncbi:MAG: hypothetical protein ACE5GM_08090 [bacterium]
MSQYKKEKQRNRPEVFILILAVLSVFFLTGLSAADSPINNRTISEKEKKQYVAYLDKTEEYQKKGDQAASLAEKEKFYALAIRELDKIKKRRPAFIPRMRKVILGIRDSLVSASSLNIKVGDSREQVIKLLGKPSKEEKVNLYFPVESVERLAYYDNAVVVGLHKGKVFSVDIRSNFKGTFHGIRIGDHFDKIRALFKGAEVPVAGSNFGYVTEGWMLSYLFVDADDKVDAIKQIDQGIYASLMKTKGVK